MQAWGARMIKVYQQPRRAQRRWFAQAAREEKMLLTAEGGGELFADLTMAMDGFTAFEHSLPVELGDDVAKFLADTETHYTPTLLVSYGGPWGELYFWQTTNPHDDPKLNRFTPHFALDNWGRRHPWIDAVGVPVPARRRGRREGRPRRRQRIARRARSGAGARAALGALVDGRRERTRRRRARSRRTRRCAPRPSAPPRSSACCPTSARSRRASSPTSSSSTPIRSPTSTTPTKIRWVVKNGEVYEAETMKRVWPTVVEPPKQYWQAGSH